MAAAAAERLARLFDKAESPSAAHELFEQIQASVGARRLVGMTVQLAIGDSAAAPSLLERTQRQGYLSRSRR